MLPSQIGQPKSRRSHMYRRRGPGRRRILIVLLILLGLSIGVWLLRDSHDDAPASLDTSTSEASVEEYAARDPGPRSEPSPQQQPQRTVGDRSADHSERVMMGRSGRSGTSGQSTQRDRDSSVLASDLPPEPESDRQPEPEPEPEADPQPEPRPERGSNDGGASDRRTPDQSDSSIATRAERERAVQRMEAGMELLRSNQPVEARRVLTHALESAGMDERNAEHIREKLTELNDRLIFSPEIVDNDPFTYGYTIRPGDSLARIRSREGLAVDWRFIQRINRISRPERIQVGQNLKLVTGPFHAIVHKSEHRMDVYLGDGSQRVYVRSFPVGLGEYNSTPVGRFRVSKDSKLIDPAWTNPRTGEHFASGDPENPIGTRWIGMQGISEAIRGMTGYGIHGTIDPDSIGRQESMGCVRLHTHDVELVYEMLVEEISTVQIVD